MKVLFLDIDGVLNSHQTDLMKKGVMGHPVSPNERTAQDMIENTDSYLMWNLGFILDNVSMLQVVISSSWGMNYNLQQFREWFKHFELNPVRCEGITPRKMSSEKCEEIGFYLSDHKGEVDDWLILDDKSIYDLRDEKLEHYRRISSLAGLIYPEAIQVIKYFEKSWCPPVIAL